jgi:hypothetical protein
MQIIGQYNLPAIYEQSDQNSWKISLIFVVILDFSRFGIAKG